MASRWKRTVPAALLASLLLVPAVGAEQTVKIGFVDMQKALNESSNGRTALERLKKLMEAKQAELQSEKEMIELKKDELDKQGLLLNETTRREREEQIRTMERDHNRKFSDTKEELGREEAKYTSTIRTDLLKVVQELGKDEGYLLVLEKQFSAILYAPESIDLTDSIIKRYDAWPQR
jgi:outer membrane protein